MRDSTIRLQPHDEDDHIFILSLNRPKQLNAFNEDLLIELRERLNSLSKLDELKAIVITSKLMNAFCTGIDVNMIQDFSNDQTAEFFYNLANLLERIASFPVPTIAVVNGYAYGAGADLAIACDYRVAGKSAQFRFPGPQFGVVLGTHRLTNEVGSSMARKWVLTNKVIKAEQAVQCGLIHELVEDENALTTGLAYAKKLSLIPKHTFQAIQHICGEQPLQTTKRPGDHAKESVEAGDFQQLFSRYIDQMKEDRK